MFIDEKIDSLQKVIKRKITYEELAPILGLGSGSAVRNRVYRKKPLLDFEIQKIDNAFFKTKQNETNFDTAAEFIDIPVIGGYNAANACGVKADAGVYSVSRKLLNDLGADVNSLRMVFAKGDSMHPVIESGDIMLIDLSKKEVYDGKIYCIKMESELYAKRLQKIPHKIKIISDNINKYDPVYFDFSKDSVHFEVIGEILWWSRTAS